MAANAYRKCLTDYITATVEQAKQTMEELRGPAPKTPPAVEEKRQKVIANKPSKIRVPTDADFEGPRGGVMGGGIPIGVGAIGAIRLGTPALAGPSFGGGKSGGSFTTGGGGKAAAPQNCHRNPQGQIKCHAGSN